jgi:hypothetical protein
VPRRARRLASGKKVRSAGPSLVLVTAASGRQFQLITEAHDAITPIFSCGSRQRKAALGWRYITLKTWLPSMGAPSTRRSGLRAG